MLVGADAGLQSLDGMGWDDTGIESKTRNTSPNGRISHGRIRSVYTQSDARDGRGVDT